MIVTLFMSNLIHLNVMITLWDDIPSLSSATGTAAAAAAAAITGSV
jgi:hypothetical protein